MQFFDEVLRTRKSIRLFEEGHQIPRELLMQMINEANQTPSSMNLQPVRLQVIEDPNMKEKLLECMYGNEGQCRTSSAMILLMVDRVYISKLDLILAESVKLGYMTPEVHSQQSTRIKEFYQNNPISDAKLAFDAGAYAMTFQLVAHKYGYGTCVIGGFNPQKGAEILGIDTERYLVTNFIAIGKKAKEPRQTYRLDAREIVQFS